MADVTSTASLVIRRADTESKPAFCYNCWYYFTVVIDHGNSTGVSIKVQQGSPGDDIPVLARNSALKFDLKSSYKI